MRSCRRTALHNAASKVDVSRARIFAAMKAYAAVDPQMPLAGVAAYARRAEQLGFDGLHADRNDDDPMRACITELQRR